MSELLIGYARVATDAQDLTAQRDALDRLGVAAERIYVDHGLTGTNRDRPGLRTALAVCREGDTLVVTKLDRLARSLPDAREIIDDLTRRHIKLSIGGSLHDPTDPVGRLLFNVLAMVAAFESDLIRLRTREGMKVAKARGRLRGKQPKLKPPAGGAPGRALRGWRPQHRRAGRAVRRRAVHGLPSDPASRRCRPLINSHPRRPGQVLAVVVVSAPVPDGPYGDVPGTGALFGDVLRQLVAARCRPRTRARASSAVSSASGRVCR